MADDKKPSVKKRRRLQLNGPDDEYAKRDAVQSQPKEEPTPPTEETTPEPKMASKPEREQVSPVKPKETIAAKPKSTKTNEAVQIPINLRLPVGVDLTTRLKALADKHGQPIEPILKTARARAAERFNAMILGKTKPEPKEVENGGEVTRFATTFSGANAELLTSWFDPFQLGVAKDGIKPIMTQLLQEEVAKICDTVA